MCSELWDCVFLTLCFPSCLSSEIFVSYIFVVVLSFVSSDFSFIILCFFFFCSLVWCVLSFCDVWSEFYVLWILYDTSLCLLCFSFSVLCVISFVCSMFSLIRPFGPGHSSSRNDCPYVVCMYVPSPWIFVVIIVKSV